MTDESKDHRKAIFLFFDCRKLYQPTRMLVATSITQRTRKPIAFTVINEIPEEKRSFAGILGIMTEIKINIHSNSAGDCVILIITASYVFKILDYLENNLLHSWDRVEADAIVELL